MFSLAGVYVVYTYLRPLFSEQLHISISLITIACTVYGFMSLLSNQLSGKIAEGPGLAFMPKVYLCQLALLIALPFLLTIPILGTIDIMLLGLTMYLINSPIQLHVLEIAEASFPQSLVLASSLNSIFANFGIALGSAADSLIVQFSGTKYVGPGGAVFTLMTLVLLVTLNRHVRRQAVAEPKTRI